jgi:hypothetical protein
MAGSNKVDLYCKILILFLVSSPCISFVYLLSGYFLSNEKISTLIAMLYWIIFNRKINQEVIKYTSILLLIFISANILRFIVYGDVIHDIDISYLIWAFTLPFYISMFIKNYENNKIAFKYILLIQSIFFVLEIIVKFYNLFPIESYLIINPVQGEYTYPEITNGFHRVSGLFNESSQISIFFCIMYYYFRNNKFSLVLVPMILATVSMTGYLMLFSIIAFKKLSKLFILYVIIIFFVFYIAIDGISGSIDYRFDLFKNMDDPRIIALVDNYRKFLEQPLLEFGSAMADAQRWDIFSVYIYSYGLIFGSMIVFIVLYFLNYFNVLFFYWPVLFTNITFQNSVNLILILTCVTIYYENRSK